MKKIFMVMMFFVVGLTTSNGQNKNIKTNDVTSKCEGCVKRFVNYYPDSVKTINQNILTNGCLYIKKRLFGFVINEKTKNVLVYWTKTDVKPISEKIVKIQKWDATHTTYYFEHGELTIEWLKIGVSYDFRHNQYPDVFGQFQTYE